MKLKLRRIAMGLSQEKLAALVGVSQGTISLWERGTIRPRKKHMAKLVEVLQCEENDLL